jgi:phosphoglucosamine mutase
VLLRYSGTESLVRVMVEGENESKVGSLAEMVAEAVRRELAAQPADQ